MSNFAFLRATIPTLHADAARAESYLASDPRSACFYARRTVEGLVDHLYALRRLPEPYQDDLAARTNAPAFQQLTGRTISHKLNLIRNDQKPGLGNGYKKS